MEKNKTRDLSVAEYFITVQKEYLIANFRRKIYFSLKDKNYYKKVMNYKIEKINNIANRNQLESVLTNEEEYNKMNTSLFDDKGKPKFEMTELDWRNYYAVENEFSFNGEIWILDSICFDETLNLRSNDGKIYKKVSKKDVSRIL